MELHLFLFLVAAFFYLASKEVLDERPWFESKGF
jgi:hypothetical protein